MKKVLLIEDDKALSNGIVLAIQSEEIHIEQGFTLSEAKVKSKDTKYDLLILDLNLPDGNGLDYIKEWKAKEDSKIIILTANDMETDVVTGLEMGADDYITKPFSLAILRARVNAQLRKNREVQSGEHNKIRIDDFVFDFEQMVYTKMGQSIELSKTEQKLLKMLVMNRGTTMERSTLVDRIWTDGVAYVDENALSVTIKRLRDKLEECPSKPRYIKTVYGIGYTWVLER